MLDSIKKALLAGLGAAVISHEKLRATLDEFVRRGELTQEQASRLFEVLLARGERESRLLAQKVVGELFRLLEKIPFVTRRELEELERRVRCLEKEEAADSAAGGVHAADAPDEVEPSAGG